MDKRDSQLPPGLNHAFIFATFNALSFQIVLGSPMVLYARSLGASATVLGLIAGMLPLLVIFQIPAASYIGRTGYKRFVYAGWGIRVAFIFAMAVVPVLTFLTPSTRLALVLFLLFAFNLSRGISSAAWLPWITSLVPASMRGRYLALDQSFIGVASCLAFVIAATCLGANPRPGQFALIFLISGINGAISLKYLKRIPDVPVPEEIRRPKQPVPWGAMIQHPPFKKLLVMNLGWSAAYGGISAFTVAFLKNQPSLNEDTILYVCSTFFLGAVASLWFGTRMDRMGSKPVMIFACLMWMFIISIWILLAGKIILPKPGLIVVLQFSMGIAAALFNMANVRLSMMITPEYGRTHFFALYSVVANLSLGLSPVLWGMLIDLFAGLNVFWHGFHWTRFSLFFVGAELMFCVTLFLKLRLEEKAAGNVEDLMRELIFAAPLRLLAKLWSR